MNIGQLKELIKDINDNVPLSISIESGRSCFSFCDDVDGGLQQDSDDPELLSFCLSGEETSSE